MWQSGLLDKLQFGTHYQTNNAQPGYRLGVLILFNYVSRLCQMFCTLSFCVPATVWESRKQFGIFFEWDLVVYISGPILFQSGIDFGVVQLCGFNQGGIAGGPFVQSVIREHGQIGGLVDVLLTDNNVIFV